MFWIIKGCKINGKLNVDKVAVDLSVVVMGEKRNFLISWLDELIGCGSTINCKIINESPVPSVYHNNALHPVRFETASKAIRTNRNAKNSRLSSSSISPLFLSLSLSPLPSHFQSTQTPLLSRHPDHHPSKLNSCILGAQLFQRPNLCSYLRKYYDYYYTPLSREEESDRRRQTINYFPTQCVFHIFQHLNRPNYIWNAIF